MILANNIIFRATLQPTSHQGPCVQPALWAGLMQPEETAAAGGVSAKAGTGKAQEDEDREVFKDLDDEEQEGGAQQGGTGSEAGTKGNGAEPGAQGAWPKPGYYDMQKSTWSKSLSTVLFKSYHPVKFLSPNTRTQPVCTPVLCREPLYAMAERACWWELLALAAHAHPSVAAMARTLMSGQPVSVGTYWVLSNAV
eukprot:1159846-Pelagomonas_calceolata.AAC.7